MSDLDHLSLLEVEVSAMTAAFAGADADAPVAACPGWTVRDVASHVTALHRWVTSAVDQTDMPAYDEQPISGDGHALAAAYGQAGEAMVTRMRALPGDQACWTFDKNNRTTSFWHRRQLHELSVHRWDIAPHIISEPVAADGIDEVLDFMLPRMLHNGRATLPEGSLELVSPVRTWTIGAGEPTAHAQGSAGDILLALWGRNTLLPPGWRNAKLMP